MKFIAWIVAIALLGLGAAAVALRNGAFDITLADLATRYQTPESRFLEVGTARVHYRDEGAGPVVVLVHASYMNLRTWDSLTAALKASHRVIRLDLIPAGLTSGATSDLSFERNVEVLGALVDHLGVARFSLLGTSSGGTVAFRYAAQHPERVERLILVNSAGLPRTPVTDPNRPRGTAIERWINKYHRSRDYWLANLSKQFSGGSAPPAWLVDMVYDMNRRAGGVQQAEVSMRNFSTGDPQATLARVVAPTLVLWGVGNITVDHLQADVFQHWLRNAPTYVRKYPKVGHYLYLEIPDTFNRDVAAFVDGELDSELRVTTLAPFTRQVQSGS